MGEDSVDEARDAREDVAQRGPRVEAVDAPLGVRERERVEVTRTAWKAYHRERGHAEALKVLEKLERRTCDHCGVQGPTTGPRFRPCAKCRKRTYCCKLCQRSDWDLGRHKDVCAMLACE